MQTSRTQPNYKSDWFYIVTDYIGRYSIHAALLIFSLICLLPLLLIVSASFTSEDVILRDGYQLIPAEVSTSAYDYLLGNPGQIIRAYLVTIFTTLVGTTVGVLLMSMLAYPLSRRDLKYRNAFSFYVFFTMLFNGGLVPFYILMTQYLGLRNNILAIILPGLVGVFYVLILRTYFSQLPQDLFDAARVDGAGEWHIFFRIVLPLSKPALATIGLMVALAYWNQWVWVLYFIDDPNLVTLQYLLQAIMRNIEFLEQNPELAYQAGVNIIPVQSVRMAMAVLATGPAAFAFLFVQKYLVRGITLGSFR